MSNSLVELVVARPKQGIHFWPYPLYNTCRVAIIISTHCYTFNYIFTLCMCSRQTFLHFVYVFSSDIFTLCICVLVRYTTILHKYWSRDLQNNTENHDCYVCYATVRYNVNILTPCRGNCLGCYHFQSFYIYIMDTRLTQEF